MTSSPRTLGDLIVSDHPLVRARLTTLRDRRTSTAEFRRLVRELGSLLTIEATRTLPTRPLEVTTPYETVRGEALARPPTVVPILRAGLGLADGALATLPEARVGHVGVRRDERSLQPVPYYAKLPPDIAAGPVLLVDPMLATGGTACHAVSLLKARGCSAITLVCLVASPEGVSRLHAHHGDVRVVAAALDRELSSDGRILPGLGDAGDRLFGTESAGSSTPGS